LSENNRDEQRIMAVYCGSSLGNNPKFAEEARKVARLLVSQDFGLVYGAGSIGIMGEVADEMLKAGCYVHGVIPRFLYEKEVALESCTKLSITEDMHTRKAIMAEEADAFLILPGGIGTMDEFFEALTWKQLGLHNKPIAVYDVGGIFESLSELLNTFVEQGFLSPQTLRTAIFISSHEELAAYLSSISKSVSADSIVSRS
jgi:hypothetical protein